MNSEAEQFVSQFEVPLAAWTVEESDYATSIHVIIKTGRSMECHIESLELHRAVVELLKSEGVNVRRLEDPRKNDNP